MMQILRSPRRKKSVALYVTPEGGLRVLAPLRVSQKWIESFIARKTDWIEAKRKKLAARQEARTLPLVDGSEVFFLGEKLKLDLCGLPEREKGWLKLDLPIGEANPDEIRTALKLWTKKQARTILPQRVAYWGARMQLSPARTIIANAEKRWGSCGPDNTIRLSWRLVILPPELMDYVVIHELAHIPHKNHGSSFWALVRTFAPDCTARRKALRAWEALASPHAPR